jgi:hypothetical protein
LVLPVDGWTGTHEEVGRCPSWDAAGSRPTGSLSSIRRPARARWRCAGTNLGTYAQIKKSFYFWYFQMLRVIEDRIRQDDFRFIRDIWGDWSPGYRADEDMVHKRITDWLAAGPEVSAG